MRKTNQSGIAHLAILLLLVLVAVAGFAAYRVTQANNDSVSNQSPTFTVKQAENIKSKTDLVNAQNSVLQQNIENDLDPSQFDEDINNLY